MEIYGSSENGAIGYRASPHEFTLLDYWKYHQPSEILRVLPTGEHKICPVQDKLSWLSERKFCPVRRLDNAVQVCGINVYPLAISKLIESHPLVKACRVRLMRPEEGSRLKAFVVPKKGVDTMCLHKELKIFCKSKMSASERPVKFTFGAAIAVNGFGKETDWT
jgi:acyl-coenzyme A synthetase/AMP-(fatty) acid ligase